MPLFFLVALLTFLIDQVSKVWLSHVLATRPSLPLGPFIELVPSWNPGVNFGLFSDAPDIARHGLALAALLVAIWAACWARGKPRWARVSVALLAGGGLGNALDRAIHEGVFDFLRVSCCGIDNPFIFNPADIAIHLGAAGLIIFMLRADRASEGRRPVQDPS